MPFRSKQTLDQWLEEFTPAHPVAETARVVIQDGPAGTDTGLVVVPLSNATTTVYMQPHEPGDPRWRVVIEPQPDETILSSSELHQLTAELRTAAELCAYLEAKSATHTEAIPVVPFTESELAG
ncbi:hypothetical protein [Litorihabitans aurantiacus]|uniref:Uncharacterized protein n=1 Tax=Litorihabitans aurantiacus TaxID=1930061 RepID=A0AA38CSQ1_9MICO|nr:hypothetical protein [Litorihabitans aurantiacus]GMA33683.1 hypothetical protein GCM10025875_36750 [Litorihabitans aurantiacus]GMA33694.1 hypothetical protein GCM10025875_36860 [Litorihabitans aurantiacus]GMA33757.1 hypothetical protein GCM10025875_37490 [Litorihabitans aurantiacus]